MSETARPMSIVPAPPLAFGRWVRRQVLAGLALTAGLILFFVARAATRTGNPFAGFEGQRLWVTGLPAPGSYGQPVTVALTPGGANVGATATAWPTVVSAAPAGGGTQTTWEMVQVGVVRAKGLVRDRPIHVGTFALLGETRTIDGAVWQEAWRMPRHQDWTDAPAGAASLAGVWHLETGAGPARRIVLTADGRVLRAPDPAGGTPDDPPGRWYSQDGVIGVALTPSARFNADGGGFNYAYSAARGSPVRPEFLVGRVASDEQSFRGVDSSGAAVTGTRDE